MNGNLTPAQAPPADVIHDPRTDWCACEPYGDDRCDYRLLADTVITLLNPPDGDDAEVAICITAVERIAAFVATLICSCARIDADEQVHGKPCPRCAVLGQRHMQQVTS